MNNKQYEFPEMEIILTDSEDVIRTSGPDAVEGDLDSSN